MKNGNTRSCGRCNEIHFGQKFGKLTVIKKSTETGKRGTSKFECICGCGKTKTILARSLLNGHTKSCGDCNPIMIGAIYGRLKVIRVSDFKSKDGLTMYDCLCECGNIKPILAIRLKNGTTKSCRNCNPINIGDRYGKLVVKGVSTKEKYDGASYYTCVCDCGNTHDVLSSRLKNGTTKSCGHCPIVNPGEVYNKLTVIGKAALGRRSSYKFKCECGKETVTNGSRVKNGQTKSCGHCHDVPLKERYGKLTIIRKSKKKGKSGAAMYDCLCDCGNEKTVLASNLKSGVTKSCGCIFKEYNREKAVAKNRYRNRIVYASKKLGMDYDIEFEDFYKMIKEPCYYCGNISSNSTVDYD